MKEVRLIDANALKEAIQKRLCISSLKYLTEQEKVIVEEINNAPTVEEVSIVEFKEPLPPVKEHKIVRALNEKTQGENFPMEIVAGKCPIEVGGNCPLKSQGECENCDYRKFSAAIIDNIVDMMIKLEIDNLDDLRKLIEETEASI